MKIKRIGWTMMISNLISLTPIDGPAGIREMVVFIFGKKSFFFYSKSISFDALLHLSLRTFSRLLARLSQPHFSSSTKNGIMEQAAR